MRPRTMSRVGGAASIALGLSIALGSPALAKQGSPVQGTCSGPSTVRLHVVENHHGKIRAQAHVETGVPGEAWTWTFTDNGVPFASDTTATDDNGELVVSGRTTGVEGPDTIDFYATDTVTGESCTAEATVA